MGRANDQVTASGDHPSALASDESRPQEAQSRSGIAGRGKDCAFRKDLPSGCRVRSGPCRADKASSRLKKRLPAWILRSRVSPADGARALFPLPLWCGLAPTPEKHSAIGRLRRLSTAKDFGRRIAGEQADPAGREE